METAPRTAILRVRHSTVVGFGRQPKAVLNERQCDSRIGGFLNR